MSSTKGVWTDRRATIGSPYFSLAPPKKIAAVDLPSGAQTWKSQAVFLCAACGLNLNADINAARNILAAGLAVIARGGSEHTPAGEPRTHPRGRRKPAASTGIPAKAVQTADREDVKLGRERVLAEHWDAS
jgi:hypothetical protein